jgi:hypothetical protein
MKEHGEYEAPDEDDRAVIQREDVEDDEDDAEVQPNTFAKQGANQETSEMDIDRMELADMQLINPNLTRFTFDKEHGQWCEIELEVMSFQSQS